MSRSVSDDTWVFPWKETPILRVAHNPINRVGCCGMGKAWLPGLAAVLCAQCFYSVIFHYLFLQRFLLLATRHGMIYGGGNQVNVDQLINQGLNKEHHPAL